jgi:predicted component of type VI protein secretion system
VMGKIITAGVFVILASTFAFTQEPGPSVAPSPPPVLAQSPPAGVIEAAATPAPTPVATPASASAAPTVGQASATASPSVEASPGVANATPVAAPTPGSTFSSQLLGGKEPELDAQERAGVEITAAWRQRSYQSMVSQAGTSGSRRRAKAGSITRRFWSTTG